MPGIFAIVQSRMGSTRLPGKVMKEVCGKTVLAHDIARISQAKKLDGIVIATTTEPADDAIVAEAQRLGIPYFRGSEQDVLARYHGAAVQAGADIVVRITSDCPLYDGELLDAMLAAFHDCDYLSNCLERTYPRGLDTEIFTFAALDRAHREAKAPHEREHVTPYIHQHPEKFRLKDFVGDTDHSHLRLTLDTEEDWQLIRAVYEALYPKNALFTTEDVLALLSRRPDIAQLNAHIEQKKLA